MIFNGLFENPLRVMVLSAISGMDAGENGRFSKEIFEADIRAGIVPPVRVYVYEDSGKTHVVTQNAKSIILSGDNWDNLKRIENIIRSLTMIFNGLFQTEEYIAISHDLHES